MNSTSWETVLPLGFIPTLAVSFIIGALFMCVITAFCCFRERSYFGAILAAREHDRKMKLEADAVSVATDA
jgi:hypothetical protein